MRLPGTLALSLLAWLAGAAEPPRLLPPEVQIAAAVAPLPEEFRPGATVLGYREGSKDLVTLREGSGAFVCLSDNPSDDRFHTACYHRSLEPFMARGRALRSAGEKEVDRIRNAEIEAGRLDMPRHPAALYSLTGPLTTLDPATGTVTGAKPLYVIYVPFATGESTGLPTKPKENLPWLMNPGTPKAHIMFTPSM
ncbi:MAG TPA: hypothetical protein VNL91_08035 [Thermoanaerobaculia bacterium]|nr:hypothetical protein [Thermoanaerobaculia bacterium]